MMPVGNAIARRDAREKLADCRRYRQTTVAERKVQVRIGGRYPLADAARAHEVIESRGTMGKLLLFP